MVIAEKINKLGIKTLDIWFCHDFSEIEKLKADIIRIAGVGDKFLGFDLQKKNGVQDTLITDLSKDENNIFSSFSSTVRNEIRKADKIGIKYMVFQNEINSEIKKQFIECYSSMYSSKGIKVFSPLWSLDLYEKNNALTITVAYYEEKPVVYHVYVNDGKNSRLLYSCSDFRKDTGNKTVIGNANRGLHFFDIKHFKKSGYAILDWGGVFSLKEPNNIDKFKLSFGGSPLTYYNLEKYSLKGKLFETIVGLIKK